MLFQDFTRDHPPYYNDLRQVSITSTKSNGNHISSLMSDEYN